MLAEAYATCYFSPATLLGSCEGQNLISAANKEGKLIDDIFIMNNNREGCAFKLQLTRPYPAGIERLIFSCLVCVGEEKKHRPTISESEGRIIL